MCNRKVYQAFYVFFFLQTRISECCISYPRYQIYFTCRRRKYSSRKRFSLRTRSVAAEFPGNFATLTIPRN